MSQSLKHAAAWNGSDPLEIVKDLIAFPTYGDKLGVEDPAAGYLADRFERLGIPTVVRREPGGKRFNVVARMGQGEPTLIFNGHLDVVPPGDLKRWSTPPFEPRMVDGNLFGRGACDAKGGLACMAAAFERLWKEGGHQSQSGAILFVAVGGEETGGTGIAYELQSGMTAAAAVVAEPTQCIPHTAHKGRFSLRITVVGKPAHASDPAAGVNAISGMMRLLPYIEQVHEALQQNHHPLLGPATSTVTQIEGGSAVNVIPGHCSVLVDRRLLPGETPEAALAQYDQAIAAAQQAYPDLRVTRHVFDVALPAETSDAGLAAMFEEEAGRVLGRSVRAAGFHATCDMAHLVHEGGIPTIIFGPGDLAWAHQYDERVPILELYQAAEVYYGAARRWLGID